MPGLRVVGVPAEKYYRSRATAAELAPLAASVVDEIIDGLVRPLTADEAAPAQIQKQEQSGTIAVGGNTYNDAAEQVYQVFLENLWADGLPVVPPTREAVAWMLSGTMFLLASGAGVCNYLAGHLLFGTRVGPSSGRVFHRRECCIAIACTRSPSTLPRRI